MFPVLLTISISEIGPMLRIFRLTSTSVGSAAKESDLVQFLCKREGVQANTMALYGSEGRVMSISVNIQESRIH